MMGGLDSGGKATPSVFYKMKRTGPAQRGLCGKTQAGSKEGLPCPSPPSSPENPSEGGDGAQETTQVE